MVDNSKANYSESGLDKTQEPLPGYPWNSASGGSRLICLQIATYYGDVYACRDTQVRVREQLCGVGLSSSIFYGDSRDQIQVPCFHGKCIYLPGYVISQKLDSGAKFLFSCFLQY